MVKQDQEHFAAITADLKGYQAMLAPVVGGVTIIGLLLGVLVAALVATRYVTRPLANVTDVMGRLANAAAARCAVADQHPADASGAVFATDAAQ